MAVLDFPTRLREQGNRLQAIVSAIDLAMADAYIEILHAETVTEALRIRQHAEIAILKLEAVSSAAVERADTLLRHS